MFLQYITTQRMHTKHTISVFGLGLGLGFVLGLESGIELRLESGIELGLESGTELASGIGWR